MMVPFSLTTGEDVNEIGRLMGGERRLGGGPADAGDTSWLMFPKDGEMFYFGQHTTWTFPLFVQMTRRLWTLIHLLLSNTLLQ